MQGISSPCHNSETVEGSLNPLQVDAYVDLWAQFLQVDDSFNKATFAANSNDPAARRALSELRRGMKGEDDSMRAAFKAALDPRFEERFLARIEKECRQESARALADAASGMCHDRAGKERAMVPVNDEGNPSADDTKTPMQVLASSRMAMVVQTRKAALHQLLAQRAPHTLLAEHALLKPVPKAILHGGMPPTVSEMLRQQIDEAETELQQLRQGLQDGSAGLTVGQAKARVTNLLDSIRYLEFKRTQLEREEAEALRHVSSVEPDLVLQGQDAAILGGLIVPWPLPVTAASSQNELDDVEDEEEARRRDAAGLLRRARADGLVLVEAPEGGVQTMMKPVEECGVEELMDAARRLYTLRHADNPDAAALQKAKVVREQEACLMQMMRQHGSDALVAKLGLRRAPIHEAKRALPLNATPPSNPVPTDSREALTQDQGRTQGDSGRRTARGGRGKALVEGRPRVGRRSESIDSGEKPIQPNKPVLPPLNACKERAEAAAPAVGGKAVTKARVASRQDNHEGGSRLAPEREASPDRRGVLRAVQLYQTMLRTSDTHAWSALRNIRLRMSNQAPASPPAALAVRDNAQAVAAAVEALRTADRASQNNDQPSVRGGTCGEGVLDSVKEALVPSLNISIDAPPPKVGETMRVAGVSKSHRHLNGLYGVVDGGASLNIHDGRLAYRQEVGRGVIFFVAQTQSWNIGSESASTAVHLSVTDAALTPDKITGIWREENQLGVFEDNAKVEANEDAGMHTCMRITHSSVGRCMFCQFVCHMRQMIPSIPDVNMNTGADRARSPGPLAASHSVRDRWVQVLHV